MASPTWATRPTRPTCPRSCSIHASSLAETAGCSDTRAGRGTGDIVNRLSFRGADTLKWLVERHGWFATALGLIAVGTWLLARRRGADRELRVRLTRICLLMALQGVIGIVQYRLKLPSEIVWVHVATATLLWVGIVLAAMQAGSPVRERVRQVAAADEGALSAGGAPAQVVRS